MAEPGPEPEFTADGARFDVVELVATVLLGVAAVAIAWCTYQSALWGGRQDEAYTESVREANNAVDQLQAADTISTTDRLLFIEILTSGVCTGGADDDACEVLTSSLSTEGATAVDAWTADPSSDPFETSGYRDALYASGEAAKVASERFFDEAGEANENGDNFELAATLLTIVMFFAGVSVVLHDRRIQWTLLGVAGVLLAGSSLYVLSLPLA